MIESVRNITKRIPISLLLFMSFFMIVFTYSHSLEIPYDNTEEVVLEEGGHEECDGHDHNVVKRAADAEQDFDPAPSNTYPMFTTSNGLSLTLSYNSTYGGYLVTPDFSQHNYGVTLQEVLEIANQSKCKDKIIILDSCFSGFMGQLSTKGQRVSEIGEGVTILTSSKADETSAEVNGRGLLTSLLEEGLAGAAADVLGNVTPGGLYAYVDKALGPWGQRPVFKTNVTRFTSLRNVEPQVDICIIRKLDEYFKEMDSLHALDPSYEWTNAPEIEHEMLEPYANKEHVAIFKELQKLESIGLVVPVDEDHRYYAAMHSKACKLTPMGQQYWKLAKEGRI